MDIFSAGCIIAEMFSKIKGLFDLPSLKKLGLQMRSQGGAKGLSAELESKLQKITDPEIEALVRKMIQVNSLKRPRINECIQELTRILPVSFSSVFF